MKTKYAIYFFKTPDCDINQQLEMIFDKRIDLKYWFYHYDHKCLLAVGMTLQYSRGEFDDFIAELNQEIPEIEFVQSIHNIRTFIGAVKRFRGELLLEFGFDVPLEQIHYKRDRFSEDENFSGVFKGLYPSQYIIKTRKKKSSLITTERIQEMYMFSYLRSELCKRLSVLANCDKTKSPHFLQKVKEIIIEYTKTSESATLRLLKILDKLDDNSINCKKSKFVIDKISCSESSALLAYTNIKYEFCLILEPNENEIIAVDLTNKDQFIFQFSKEFFDYFIEDIIYAFVLMLPIPTKPITFEKKTDLSQLMSKIKISRHFLYSLESESILLLSSCILLSRRYESMLDSGKQILDSDIVYFELLLEYVFKKAIWPYIYQEYNQHMFLKKQSGHISTENTTSMFLSS